MSSIPHHPESWYQESPYGPVAAELGLAAVRAVNVLADVPEWRGGTHRRWLSSDYVAFQETVHFAYQAQRSYAMLCIPNAGEVYDRREEMPLDFHLDHVYQALPFSEGERHWLVQLFEAGVQGDENGAKVIVKEANWAECVMEAGQMRPLDGRDLLDRWWAWRRGVFEFEDGTALNIACKGLSGIADITLPRMRLSSNAEWRAKTTLGELMRIRLEQLQAGAAVAEKRVRTRAAHAPAHPST